ncbi:MarR family winged helix-turn-helix transcriptional regulator [Methylocystis echinoides]|uniref:MarR family transcriptional regulator n=1 Tax=Methylocystis echinoides TaxID=29468 RepID=A0A9W6GT33_9HYPH|nr:MarR family winged helix-turn-helix transcriptional regulator [Methylocystis echinoides]GLI92577.1 MarR family transcriptional regulator [Methylocystis echinoides]
MRADQWTIAGTAGLNPTQAHVLTYIAGRAEKGVRVGAIAAQLGVSQPTATDSVAALVRKGLLTKAPDPEDARAVAMRITQAGRDIVRGIGLVITATERALETLSDEEQAELLQLVIKTIRALQIAGAISPQRMCVTCRYFRPNAHNEPKSPHHCDYVGVAFGAESLRLDCGDHEALSSSDEQALWRSFTGSFPELNTGYDAMDIASRSNFQPVEESSLSSRGHASKKE